MRAVAGVAALTLVLVGALFIGFGDSDPAPVELTTVDLLATTTGAVSEEGEEESSESEGVDEAPSSSSAAGVVARPKVRMRVRPLAPTRTSSGPMPPPRATP